MSNLKILISVIAIMLASPSTADERLVEADGTAMKTAEMPDHVFEARAIANALQSVVDTGAQYLDSFSLVELHKKSCQETRCLLSFPKIFEGF